MPTLLDRGVRAHIRRMKTGAGKTIVYQRGELACNMTAWIGSYAISRGTDDPPASVIFAEKDYLFAASDLFIGGALTLPLDGDRIIETIDGQDTTWEITPFHHVTSSGSTGEPPWRYSDFSRQIIRVHCKRVKVS